MYQVVRRPEVGHLVCDGCRRHLTEMAEHRDRDRDILARLWAEAIEQDWILWEDEQGDVFAWCPQCWRRDLARMMAMVYSKPASRCDEHGAGSARGLVGEESSTSMRARISKLVKSLVGGGDSVGEYC